MTGRLKQKKSIRRLVNFALIPLLTLALIALAWAGLNRSMASSRAVRIVSASDSSRQVPAEGFRIAAYNIAHARGGPKPAPTIGQATVKTS